MPGCRRAAEWKVSESRCARAPESADVERGGEFRSLRVEFDLESQGWWSYGWFVCLSLMMLE